MTAGRAAREGGVAALVDAAADAHPDRPALLSPDGAGLRWSQVAERVAGVAGWLAGLGAGPGQRVALVLPNSVEFALAYWATLRTGAAAVTANPVYTAPELAHILDDSAPVVVLTSPALAQTVTDAAQRCTPPPPVQTGIGTAQPVRHQPEAGDTAVICYTSGTTGRPKGAELTHGNFLANLDAFSSLPRLNLTAEDVLVGVLPFFHIFGLNVILNAAANAGAGVLVLDRFSPAGSLEVMDRCGASVAYGAPPMFAAWSAAASATERPRRLRAAISGADTLPAALWERYRAAHGLEIMEGYGLTETAPVLTSTVASPQVRPGSVGHPIPGVEVRVVDPAGADVASGVVGEIIASGPNIFRGYRNDPAATAAVLRAGWFHTGDLGTLDPDGYLTIAGRLKDLIIVSGFNVYPREVELALTEHPAVTEAAVIGLPDERTGERIRAVVVAAGSNPPTTDELLAHCRERLARFKLPREIAFAQSLPRTALGKVRRQDLRET